MADQITMTDTPGEQPTQDAAGGYRICIDVGADGKIGVGVETAGQENSESGAGYATQPAGNIREAMQMAMEIYQNQGQMSAGEDDFNAGYGSRPQEAAPIREASEM